MAAAIDAVMTAYPPPEGYFGGSGLAARKAVVSRVPQERYTSDESRSHCDPQFKPYTESVIYYRSTRVYANGARFFGSTVQHRMQPKGLGDLLLAATFSCLVPFSPYPCLRDFGNRVFKKMVISSFGREIQSISGEFASMNAVMASTDYQKANITGEMTNLGTHPDEAPERVDFTKVSVPIPFFFNPYESGVPLPTCALWKADLDITWEFQDNAALYLVPPRTPSWDGQDYDYVDLEIKGFDNYHGYCVVEENDRLFVYRSSWNYAKEIRVFGHLLCLRNWVGIGKQYPGTLADALKKPTELVKYVTTTTFENNDRQSKRYQRLLVKETGSSLKVADGAAARYYGRKNPDIAGKTARGEADVESKGWFKIHSGARVSIGISDLLVDQEALAATGVRQEKLIDIDLKQTKLIFQLAKVTSDERLFLTQLPRSYNVDNCYEAKFELDLEKPYHTFYLNSALSVKNLYWYFAEIADPTKSTYSVKKINHVFVQGKLFKNDGKQRLETVSKDFLSYYMSTVDGSNNALQHYSFAFTQSTRGKEVRGKLFRPPRPNTSTLYLETQQTPINCTRVSRLDILSSNAHLALLPYQNWYVDQSFIHMITTQVLGILRLPQIESATKWPMTGIGIGKRYLLSGDENTVRASLGLAPLPENPGVRVGQVWYTTTEWKRWSNGDPRRSIYTEASNKEHIEENVDETHISENLPHVDRTGWVQIKGYQGPGSTAQGGVSINTPITLYKSCMLHLIYVSPRRLNLRGGTFKEIDWEN